MENLKQFKCKTCGEMLDPTRARDGVLTCEYCGGVYTLPKDDTPNDVRMMLLEGEHDIDTGKFDDAKAAFSRAIERDPTEPEAYWGMAIANNSIQYLLDEKVEDILGRPGKRLQPICHRIDDEKFTDDPYFQKALACATPDQRTEYLRRGAEIDHIKREFYRLKQTGLDYDCFICVKVSKNTVADPSQKTSEAEKTDDSDFAHRIYRMLKGKYVPFYSEAVLSDETGADYEAHILYALATSETMLIVCFDETYLDTKWVKNEYTRFLKLVNDEEKESDSIVIAYKGKPIEKLPGKNGKIQGINLESDDWSYRILNFVENHTPEAKRRREEQKRRAEEEEKRRREEERLRNEQINALLEENRKREEYYRELFEKQANQTRVESVSGPTADTLLKRARQELKLGNKDEAKNYYLRILESNPEHATAWYGLMLLGFNCSSDDELAEKLTDDKFYSIFNSDKSVNMVREYADYAMHDRFNKLFTKRKQVLADKIADAEKEISKKRNDIYENEKAIDDINYEISDINRQLDAENEQLSAKRAELDNLKSELNSKQRQAQPYQNKADAARRKRNKVKTLDHSFLGGEFLADFWLDEGVTFTLANIWEAVFEKASEFRLWVKKNTKWPCLVRIIFWQIWLSLRIFSLFAYPLAFLAVIVPLVVAMGVVSALLVALSLPYNIYVLIHNITNKGKISALTNEVNAAQRQADDLVKDAQANVDACNKEITARNAKLDKLRSQIKTKEKSIDNYKRNTNRCENDISALNKQIEGWEESIARVK